MLRTSLRAAALAVVVAVTTAHPAAAQFSMTPGVWTLFTYNDGAPNPVDGDGFTFATFDPSKSYQVRLVDVGSTGDAFDIFDGTVTRSMVSAVLPGEDVYLTDDPIEAFLDARFSRLIFDLTPQASPYLLTLSVNTTAVGVPNGEGYIMYEELQAVPEPASVVLLATGLLAFAGVARRRRSATAPR